MHNNDEYMKYLQEKAQEKFEETHSREEFLEEFTKNRRKEEPEEHSKRLEEEGQGFWFVEDDENTK